MIFQSGNHSGTLPEINQLVPSENYVMKDMQKYIDNNKTCTLLVNPNGEPPHICTEIFSCI